MSRRYGMSRLGGTVLAISLVGISWIALWAIAQVVELAVVAWERLVGT